MELGEIKQTLQQYIEDGDQRQLEQMYAAARDYDKNVPYDFSDAEILVLNERRERYLSGEDKLYSYEDAMDFVTGKKKME